MAYLVKMINLYSGMGGMVDTGYHAYFRKQGTGGFDFVNASNGKQYATRFESREEAQRIVNDKDFYCKMFKAEDMIVVSEVKVHRKGAKQ